MLFGVFAQHSPESCPLNNEKSKEIFINIKDKMDAKIKDFNVNQIIGFYMSVLEHEWIIIFDAVNAHDIEQLCIDVGISSISTVKIVPMSNYLDTLNRIKAGSH